MRAVFFDFVRHYGGASRSTLELSRRLGEHLDVSVVDGYGTCKPFIEAAKKDGIDYHSLCPDITRQYIGGRGLQRIWRLLASAKDMRKVRLRAAEKFKQLKADIVFCNNIKSAFVLAYGPQNSLGRTPLVIIMRGWYTPDMVPSYAKKLFEKPNVYLFAVSYATKSALICSGVNPDRIHVVHNPLDIDDILQRSLEPLYAELPQRDRPVRLLVPAAIQPQKGIEIAIRALPGIRDAGHDTVLWIAGPVAWAVDENKDFPERMKDLTEQLGVSGCVEWLGNREDLPRVIKESTHVVMPTKTEGHPRTLLEAMALAKPIATTPAGGILDMISHRMTGMMFDIDDVNGLVSCMNELIECPDLSEKIGQNAQQLIKLSFKPSQQTSHILSLVDQIVNYYTFQGSKFPRAKP